MASEPVATAEVTTPNLELVFNKDNPSNCILTPSNGSGPCYSAVAKLRGEDMITTYRKSQSGSTDDWESTPIIGSLEWREVFSDKLALAGKPLVSSGKILKKKMFSTTVSFSDDQGRKYEWRGYGAGLQMVLFEKDGKDGIAGFKKSRLNHASGVVTPAVLTLSPRAVEIIDLVIVTFLVLEKQRRIDDNSSNNKADAMTSADIGIGNVTGGNNIYGHGV
ncbi:hypothetical protein FRC12_013036 [Ceratobasidium sp. 428]|nr:hypothetical protein FRC09_010724 [Ceratobasidium sp. 395]KAG8789981.1 hypothetical protein FRC12_013036 [Ceratobasidium sp. 428]